MDRGEQIISEIKEFSSYPDGHEFNVSVALALEKVFLELDSRELSRFMDILYDRFPEEYNDTVYYSIAQLGFFDDPDEYEEHDPDWEDCLNPKQQEIVRAKFKEEEQFCSGKRRSLYSFIDEDNCGTLFPPAPKYLPKWSELSEKQKFDAFYQCNIREMWGTEVFEEAKALSKSSGVPLGWMNFQI